MSKLTPIGFRMITDQISRRGELVKYFTVMVSYIERSPVGFSFLDDEAGAVAFLSKLRAGEFTQDVDGFVVV